MAKYNEKGEQIPDPTPVEVPLRFTRPAGFTEEVLRVMREEMSRRAQEAGQESFEEADDFFTDDDDDLPMTSQYELDDGQEREDYRENVRRGQEVLERLRKEKEDGERKRSESRRSGDAEGRTTFSSEDVSASDGEGNERHGKRGATRGQSITGGGIGKGGKGNDR